MPPRLRSAPRARLGVELLESRLLLSGSPLPTLVLEATPGNTLNLASPAMVSGNIGSGPAGAADVDWYSFTLIRAGTVTLSASPQSGQAAPVVSLYNNDVNDFNDPYDPLGHRLLAQAEGGPGSPTGLTQELAAGTYFVAVSGAGNRTFNPFLADSGYPGSTGAYTLLVTTAALSLNPGDGPVVLDTTPGTGQDLAASPLIVRVDLSGSLDLNTVIADQTVRLLENPTGAFGNGNDTDVPLSSVSYSDGIAEVQILPAQALAPGYYEILLAGNSSGGGAILTDPSGTPLGKDAAHPSGQDITAVFHVSGVDGTPGTLTSDDTPATAHELGSIAGAGLVQVAGSIGSDPAYNVANADPYLANPAAQVNLYRFEVNGPGNYALSAEVFAGRIGSPLDPGLSLFSVDPSGHLNLVAANDNTLNSSQATDGTAPLFTDPALFSGLTQGTYYLAVSGTGNVPDPTQGQAPGSNGVFDPNVSHSGYNGFTTGDYVLNLAVQASTTTPQVTGVSVRTDTDLGATTGTPAAGAQLAAPPTVFEVQFNEPVNLQQLAYQATQQNPAAGLAAVTVTVPPTAQNANAQVFHPRLLSYDPVTGLAQFLMLDAVPSGPYASGQVPALHLSGAGPDGITDLAGNPLAGGGEVVVPFSVNGPPRGTGSNPLQWTEQEPNNSLASAQPLGVLFPNELQSHVVLQRNLSPAASDTADYYSFSVLQSRSYVLRITGTGLPTPPLAVYSAAQQQWLTGTMLSGGRILLISLDPGQYILEVGSWTVAGAPSVSYQLSLSLAGSASGAQPLTVGPAPVIRLVTAQEPNPTPPTPMPPAPPPPAPTPPQTPPAPTTPSVAYANPNDRFVANAYLDLLGRGVDSGGLSDKGSRLGAGTSTTDIALEIDTSAEYSTAFVVGLYRSLLHRTPSRDEVSGWVAALNGGSTWARVEAAFLGSAEYFATRGGGNDSDFVTAVYEDVLGRAPDAGGLAAWGAALAGGMSREKVAGLILGSQEAGQVLVAGWYQAYLHRQADAGGLASWVGMLQGGASEEKVLADILGSQEYYARQ